MGTLFPGTRGQQPDSMVFVDGENLAIRYGKMLAAHNLEPHQSIFYKPGVYLWSGRLNAACLSGNVKRKHLYTSVVGDDVLIADTEEKLKLAGIEAPRVFKRTRNRGSKRVDISLATEMLMHATHRNYETAVLVAGDEDYVPLVEAVQSEGRRVFIWFVEDGLSPVLRRKADYYADLWEILTATKMSVWH